MHLLGAWLLLFVVAQSVPAPAIPSAPGVYYAEDGRNYIRLPEAPISQAKLQGKGLFVETGGFTNLGTDVICTGATASTRVSVPRPTFYVREIGSPSDVLLFQLTKHKENRSFHKSSGDTTVENKVGVKKGDIRKTAVTIYRDDTFSITPTVDLKPGEYLLVIGDSDASYDFGVDKK